MRRVPLSPEGADLLTVPVFQIAFEVLSFVSVVSNCWLLLLSPWLQNLCREGGWSSTNVLLVAILVEVRGEWGESHIWNYRSMTLLTFVLVLQHVLILVKVVISVLIPDEPDWVRKKMEHIEFTSMQALREQVNPPPDISVCCRSTWSP